MSEQEITFREDKLAEQGFYKIPEGSVVISRAELDALTKYAKKTKAELVSAIFNDVEELLQMAIKTEGNKALFGDIVKHKYAKRLCQTLVADLRKIERKYRE